ncbi:MAG: ABC transporter permease subunit, partial [Candidatus Obscuribacterales bacterium]|nr:ABC transporter permease subunit [Steroidobacteraceae bacterium]
MKQEIPSGAPTLAVAPAQSPVSKDAAVKNRSLNLEPFFNVLNLIGIGFLVPVMRLCRGENPRAQAQDLWRLLGIPMLAIVVFIFAWSRMSATIETSLGKIPGPVAVWQQTGALWLDHKAEREKAVAFYERQEKRTAEKLAQDPSADVSIRKYTGKPTYIDQIFTSLKTVFTGFMIATMVAVPLGILCGLSPSFNSALNPLIQVFKPVSPLAWLPIVTMVVSALYVTADPMFAKSFLISAITVSLCSLWPTIINTTLGVSSIDKDLLNVAKVLQLSWSNKLFKLVLPSSLPLIFT